PLAFVERPHAACEPFAIEWCRVGLDRYEHAAELLEELLLALRAPPEVEHGHAARAEHERRELHRIAQASGPQGLERRQQHLLDEVVGGGRRPQVTQAVEPDARTHPATYLRLG